jgi:hypothetical protein
MEPLSGSDLGQVPPVVGENAIAVGIVWAAHLRLLRRMIKAAKFAGFHPEPAGPIANWKVIALVSGNIETVSGLDAPVPSPLRGL